jgi:hypothetical protein
MSEARKNVEKLRGIVSALQFGAVGDGATDDTAALQAAINGAYAQNKALYIPGGRYRYTNLTFTPSDSISSGQGLRIYGDTSGNTYTSRGSILECVASSGTAFLIDSTVGACHLELANLTFKGNSNVSNGLVLENNFLAKIENCVFSDFDNASAGRAIWFKPDNSGAAYSGSTAIVGTNFQSNTIGIASGDVAGASQQVNYVTYERCIFLDHTTAAIQIGYTGGSLMQARSHTVRACDFEGNARDILGYASTYALSVTDSYFENNTATSNPRIELAYGGVSASGEAITITGNFFQQGALTSGSSVLAITGNNQIVRNNFCANGNQTDRYFLTATSATTIEAEPAAPPAGITPLPIRIAGKTYVQQVNLGLRPEPLVTNTANAARIYQGSGTPNNSLGAAGDIYINTTITGANATARDALWQRATTFWHRVQYQERVGVIPYSASMNPDLGAGAVLTVTPTDGNAFTFALVANAGPSQVYSIVVINTTGGSLGTATFTTGPGGYKLAGSWTQPATGFRRSVTFYYDATDVMSYELSRNAADVPN